MGSVGTHITQSPIPNDFEMDNLTDAVLRYCLFTAEILDFDEQEVVQQVQEFYADFGAIDPLPFYFEHSK
ncbi:hypothetical protein ACP70R_035202 [Stipagrostis hirtigluma subsp. patula]